MRSAEVCSASSCVLKCGMECNGSGGGELVFEGKDTASFWPHLVATLWWCEVKWLQRSIVMFGERLAAPRTGGYLL